jgi:hypothetical protein
MSKKKKILLGIISFLPAPLATVSIIAYIAAVIIMAAKVEPAEVYQLIAMFVFFFVPFIATPLFTFLSLTSTIFLVLDAAKNPKLDEKSRIVWILILCLIHGLSQPIYWYLYIWRNDVKSNLK